LQDKLKALAELQKVDLEIAALRKSGEVFPRQMAELEKELAAVRSLVEAERTRLTELEQQKRTLEQNVTDEKDKVKKWEARLAEQRSTREYAALAREIDIARKANATMAEEIIELGKQAAAAREALKTREAELAGRRDQIGGQLNALREKASSFDGQVKELDEKRGNAAQKVDRTLLTRYETIRKRRLPVLVYVDAGTCTGCRMRIPPQLYNTLKVSLGTDICPSCNRMICAPEAVEAPAAE
jgi:predicted  nucleic acid-binding Zn-ribbon protein